MGRTPNTVLLCSDEDAGDFEIWEVETQIDNILGTQSCETFDPENRRQKVKISSRKVQVLARKKTRRRAILKRDKVQNSG